MKLGLVSNRNEGPRGRGGRRKGGRWGPNAGTAGSARRARRRQMLRKDKETREGKVVPDEVARKLGEANLCYATGE